MVYFGISESSFKFITHFENRSIRSCPVDLIKSGVKTRSRPHDITPDSHKGSLLRNLIELAFLLAGIAFQSR